MVVRSYSFYVPHEYTLLSLSAARPRTIGVLLHNDLLAMVIVIAFYLEEQLVWTWKLGSNCSFSLYFWIIAYFRMLVSIVLHKGSTGITVMCYISHV